LTWQPEEYHNITYFTLPQGITWLPDVVLTNGERDIKEMGGDFYYMLINHTGHITWSPFQVFQTRCEIDVAYFPFDIQTCELIFSIWRHDISMANLLPGEILLYEYYKNGIWSLLSNNVTLRLDQFKQFDIMKFSFTIQRKYKFYLWNFIFPLVLLGFLKLCVFFIPAQSGEKVSFAITLCLSYGVFVNLITSSLPENSESVSLVCAYTEAELALAVFIAFITSVQVGICNRDHGRDFSKYDIYLIRLFYKKGFVQQCIQRAKEGETDWALLSSAVDKLMMILIIAVEIIILCILFVLFISYENEMK
jgi:hypothetical protein